MSKRSSSTDPAIEAFERWRRAGRALNIACSRRFAAEDECWNGPHYMHRSACVFPDDQQDAERAEYEKRYNDARKAAVLADIDAAERAAREEYWSATASLVRVRATTPLGVLAKAKWMVRNIPNGTTPYDGAMVRSLARDLKRQIPNAA